MATPQTNATAFTGTNTLTAQDVLGSTYTAFDASADNVTMAPNTPLTGTVSGLSGGNKLTSAGDFSSGVANLTTLGMKYTGNSGSGTFTATSVSGKTGTSGSVTINAGAANAVQSTLTPTSASITANGVSTQVLTVQAKDANGNNLTTGGSTVTITKSSGTGTIGSVTDNSNGAYTATVTSPTSVGSGVFVATLGGSNVQSGGGSQTQSTITYVPGAANAVQSTLTPTSASITANGVSTQVLTVQAKDANGNNLTTGGSTVTITKQSGTGTIGSVTDNSNGTYTATVTSPTSVGSGVFVATLGGNPVQSGGGSQTQSTITYVPGAANAVQSTLTPTSVSITANGVSTQVLTVQAKDANGNNLTTGGSTVTITKQSGTGTIGSVTDNSNGTYTATVTSPTATGSGVFVATLGGNPVQSGGGSQTQSTITYTPGTANAVQSTLTPTSASITANGVSTQVLTVQAKDANGNNLTIGGSTVTITKQSGTGTIGSVTDNSNGTYTATVTSPTATGSGVFVATLGGNPVQSGGGSQTQSTITYVPGAANAVQSTLTPTSASITANGVSTQVLTVQAKDANGNNLITGGSTVTITKSSGTGSIGSVTDNSNGTYTATVTSPTSTGSGIFVATLGGANVQSGGGSQTQSTITYVPGAANAVQSTLTPTSASITANGVSTQVLTVQAKDANGNNLTTGGSTVTITKSSGTGSIGSVTDNSNGTYTATVTSPTATGSGVFVATLGGNPVQSGGGSQTQSTITYVPGAANAVQSTLTPTSASITANGVSTQVLTVQAKDANGNNLTTGGSTVTITKQSGTGTIGSVTDNSNGTYTATVTSPTATGSGVFVATLGGANVQNGTGSQTQSTITYTPGAANAVQSTLTPTSASITANGISTQVLTVQAKDANGNNLTTGGSTVTITKQSGTGSIGSVTDNSNGTYTATVTSPTSTGSGVFVATLGGNPVQSGGGSQTQATITYTPGTANAVQSTLTPTSASITANGVSTQVLTVQAKDANGNNLTIGGSTVTITKQSGTGSIGSVTDNSNGTYTATVISPTSVGSGVFVATLGGSNVQSGTGSQTQSTITYTVGALDHFAIAAISSPQVATIPFSINIAAQDANNNTVTSFNGTVNLSANAGTISPSVSGTFSGGLRSESVTVAVAGSGRTISVDDGSGHTGTSGSFAVNKEPTTSTLTASPNPSTFEQSVTLKDSVSGSFPDGGKVYFKIDNVVSDSANINGSGVASVTNSTISAGSHSISAFYGGTSNFDTSTSNSVTQVVNQSGPVVTLTSNLNPSVFEQNVTFKVTVTNSAHTPTGSVNFYDGATLLGNVALSGDSALISSATLTAGSHTIKAVYGGDSNFKNDSSTVTQVVNQSGPVVTLTSNLNPSVFEQNVTFKVTVTNSSHTPTGSVNFYDGATLLGNVALVGDSAQINSSTLTAGSHTIKAVYSGDSNFKSDSSNVTQVVNQSGRLLH